MSFSRLAIQKQLNQYQIGLISREMSRVINQACSEHIIETIEDYVENIYVSNRLTTPEKIGNDCLGCLIEDILLYLLTSKLIDSNTFNYIGNQFRYFSKFSNMTKYFAREYSKYGWDGLDNLDFQQWNQYVNQWTQNKIPQMINMSFKALGADSNNPWYYTV